MTPETRIDTLTITRTLRYGQGYGGRTGERCWAARITGTSDHYGLERIFLESIKVEREHFGRPRTMVDVTYELETDGLYELSESGERWIVAVVPRLDGTPKIIRPTEARIKAWVAALDAGQPDREARLASKSGAVPAVGPRPAPPPHGGRATHTALDRYEPDTPPSRR